MTFTALARILFRRKEGIGRFFLVTFVFFSLVSLFVPVRYESQVMLERKPLRLSPQVGTQNQDVRFDMTRLTSETQRVVAMIKSRLLMERWVDAVGKQKDIPENRDKAVKALSGTLSVQPVNYTDVFVLKVQAPTAAEATRRVGLLADIFGDWDTEQNKQEAENLISVLRSQLDETKKRLVQEWASLQKYKAERSLTLLASSVERERQTELDAQEKLYDKLTAELEEAQRQTLGGGMPRTRILVPATASSKPITSRARMFLIAATAAVLLSLLSPFLFEWKDTSIRRLQDIARVVPSVPIVMTPRFESGDPVQNEDPYLDPIVDAVSNVVRTKGRAIVQVVSPSEGDGKSTICAALARSLAEDFKPCILHKSHFTSVAKVHAGVTNGTSKKGLVAADVDSSIHLEKEIETLKDRYNVFLLDIDSVPQSVSFDHLVPWSDVTCIVFLAGKTSRHLLRIMDQQLQRLRNQKIIFVLNKYEDPLPQWLKT